MDNQQPIILSATVDRLAFIKAQIADLQIEEANVPARAHFPIS